MGQLLAGVEARINSSAMEAYITGEATASSVPCISNSGAIRLIAPTAILCGAKVGIWVALGQSKSVYR